MINAPRVARRAVRRTKRGGNVLLHRALRELPGPPTLVSAPEPLAEPPPGSGLHPVMGDHGYPLVGHTVNWMYRGPLEWGELAQQRYGRVFWGGMLGRQVLTVGDADALLTIMHNRDGHWSNEEGWNWLIGPFFDGGIMLMDDPDHHQDRRIMASAFTGRRLRAYLTRLSRVTSRSIDGWRPGRMHAYPALKSMTLDVATDVFLDEASERDRVAQVNRAFIDCVRAGTALVRRGGVPGSRWQRGLEGRAVLEDYFAAKVPAHRASDGDDLLTALCHATDEDGASLSDESIVDHIIFLMMAAHDTATITSSAILYMLALHPEWQERCAAESASLPDRLGFDDVASLKSLDLVMKEALRMIPPVPAMGRAALVDTTLGGRYVPAGTPAMVSTLMVHHDPVLWKEPGAFDPGRFSSARREDKVHPMAYMPFGGGAHLCIGMHFGQLEVKTIVHQVLRRFRVSLPGREQVDIGRDWDWTSLPKPLDDLPLTLMRR